MRHMTITLKLAFFDSQEKTIDGVVSSLIDHALDGLDAEIATTTYRAEQDHELPDPAGVDYADKDTFTNAPIDPYDQWQDAARAAMDI